jgi:two-component system, response regulator YesN
MYEIAEQVGFQNADYFAAQFEKLENMTPTDYRKQMIDQK